MQKIEVMDLTTVCQSFPEVNTGLECITSAIVLRDQILQTIDDMLCGNVQLISIEGDEEVGKTTLIVQFAKSHANNCISLFIKPSYSLGYDPEVLKYDLCNQINWILKKEEIDPEIVDDSFLRNALIRLGIYARNHHQKYYFAIDGLFDIPENPRYYQNLILDMLPIGAPNFRFIFSGDLNYLPDNKIKSVKCKSFPLTGFTLDETIKFFGDLPIDRKIVEELHQTCRRMPGRLASAKRILQSGVDPNSIINQMTDELKDWFEIEWRGVDTDNELQALVLAIIAFDPKIHNITELAKVLCVSSEEISNVVENLRFLCTDKSTETLTYVSESFRKFAGTKLLSRKEQSLDYLISYLLQNPKSDKTLSELPSYLEQTERFDELLNYLSPGNFAEILKRSQSLFVVKQKADLGLIAASKLSRDGDLVRFSMQKSILKEIGESDIWRSEIEARMAISDYDSAIALAQSVYLKEDRLHLLAVMGKKIKEHGLRIPPELIEQIRSLYNEIDHEALGERAVDIASDLIHFAADIAIELVEMSTNNQENHNALDLAYAKLSISALNNSDRLHRPNETLENLSLKIKDPEVRLFSTRISLLVGDYSGSELLAEIEKLENSSDKVYMLRKWAVENRDSSDAAGVIESALNLIIRTSTYAPNAAVLRELATPLPYILDHSILKQLISTFDGLRSSVEHSGPTQDFIILQILIVEAEAKYDLESAGNRAVDIYLYISDLKDLAVKTACMAQLVASMDKIDPNRIVDQKHGILTLAGSDLEQDLKDLLDSTGDHYQAVKGAVWALAQSFPQQAHSFALKLNTEYRRNKALSDIVKSTLTLPITEIDYSFIYNITNQISDSDYQDKLIVKILTKIFAHIEGINDITTIIPLLDGARKVSNNGVRCKACCLAYKILLKMNNSKYSGLTDNMLNELSSSWEAIDESWNKVDIGFKIVNALADKKLELAKNYFYKTEQFRDELLFDSKSTSKSYLLSLRLAIRAYSGLLSNRIDNQADFDRIERLINRIPSYGNRVLIWAEVALRYHISKRFSECVQVVNEHIKPTLKNIPQNNKNYYNFIVKTIAPALYCAHRSTAFDYISNLPSDLQDGAIIGICRFILQRILPNEPYEYKPNQGYDIKYEDVVDLIELLDRIEDDGWIYLIITYIVDSIQKYKNNFTIREQVPDIAKRLSALIGKKLPCPKNIKHDGYKIIASAEVARLTKAQNNVWLKLLNDAKHIPNLADRAYVLGVLAITWRTNTVNTVKRANTIKEAQKLIDQIPASYDQIEHYEMLASMVSDIDAATCKKLIQTAMSGTFDHNDSDMGDVRKRIVDLAYRVDPDLAASLASLSDDDEARRAMRFEAKMQFDFLELKQGMADRKKPEQIKDKIHSPLDYSRAAWKLLGSLNARRITPCQIKDTREYIDVASGLPLTHAYPILSWVVENAKKRYANTNQAHQYLRPIFDAALMGAELCGIMAERTCKNLKRTTINAAATNEETSILIRPKDREVAINYLTDWISNEVKSYLKICDPFIGPDELSALLQLIILVNPECNVQILSSIKHHKNAAIPEPWGVTYTQHWRKMSDQEPPYTEITIVGTRSQGEPPIHDRWWVSNGSGLRFGTSFNSLGTLKITDISKLSREEARSREELIDQYLNRVIKDLNGERLDYQIFTI